MVTTTGPNRLAQVRDQVRDQVRTNSGAQKWALGTAAVLTPIGIVMIASVARDLSAPSVFMGGIACLVVATVAVAVLLCLADHRVGLETLQAIQEQLAEMRVQRDEESHAVNQALWEGGRRGGREGGGD